MWEEAQETSFKLLKKRLTTAPALTHADPNKILEVTTDASRYAVGATLSQDVHLVSFLSHRLSDTEERWDTGDQELLAFIIALKQWDVYLKGRPFILRTDHEPYVIYKRKLA